MQGYTNILHSIYIQGYPRELTVAVQSFTLHLYLNEILIPPHFTSRHYDEDGNEIVEKGHVNCFYQGSVGDHPDWVATLSTCHGLRGSFGNLSDRDQYFHIEPFDQLHISLELPHALYLSSELPQKDETCGSDGHVQDSDAVLNYQLQPVLEDHDMNKRGKRQQGSSGILVVEWALVNDNRQYTAFNSNLSSVVMRDIEIANYVNGLYSGLRVNISGVLGVRIALVSVTTWTSGDQIQVVSNPDTLLSNFEAYTPQISDPHDSAMLITGIDLDGSTVGLAFLRTMCSDTSSVGLSQDGGRPLESVGSTAAHELGHIFNMNHDDDRACTCNDASNLCIMSAVIGFPAPVSWSSCSEDDITSGFNNFDLDRCLQNSPLLTVGDPICGNGIREQEEVCDCGSVELCYLHECVPVDSLSYVQPCSEGSNGLTCSGNGTCNNRNLCSCDVGSTGDACQDVPGSTQGTESATTVPTVESESVPPPTTPAPTLPTAIIAVAVVVAVVLLAVLAAIIVLVFFLRRRRRRRRSGAKDTAVNAPDEPYYSSLLQQDATVSTKRNEAYVASAPHAITTEQNKAYQSKADCTITTESNEAYTTSTITTEQNEAYASTAITTEQNEAYALPTAPNAAYSSTAVPLQSNEACDPTQDEETVHVYDYIS